MKLKEDFQTKQLYKKNIHLYNLRKSMTPSLSFKSPVRFKSTNLANYSFTSRKVIKNDFENTIIKQKTFQFCPLIDPKSVSITKRKRKSSPYQFPDIFNSLYQDAIARKELKNNMSYNNV